MCILVVELERCSPQRAVKVSRPQVLLQSFRLRKRDLSVDNNISPGCFAASEKLDNRKGKW